MHSFAAAGAAFLICVLWFDLMFDTQVRGHDGEVVPETALASISGYYRGIARAWPMNRLVALVMLLTVLVIVLGDYFRRVSPVDRMDLAARRRQRDRTCAGPHHSQRIAPG